METQRNQEGLTPLTELTAGQSGTIQTLLEGPFNLRLSALGFVPGSSVQCRQKAPWKGPIEFEVRGSRFCLRHEEAHKILIHPHVAKD